jgi:hypothetical protein
MQRGSAPTTIHPGWPSSARPLAGGLRRWLWRATSWLLVLLFLAWALRLVAIEGYLYPATNAFAGDFKFAITGESLPPGEWWAGRGLFYGPIFVLEWKYLLYPGRVSITDVAHLDLALFALSFLCTWLTAFDRLRPRLLLMVLAAWLANSVTITLLAAAQHLEVLELATLAVALLLLQRHRPRTAGLSLGLAIATKTLPVVFLPYLIIMRRWSTLALASALASCLLLVACAVQGVTPWDGIAMLLNQGENLNKTKATEYELGLRAFMIRYLTNGLGNPTPAQTALAFGVHAVVSLLVAAWTALVVWRSEHGPRSLPLIWGLIATTMLVVAPVTHIFYYAFLLPAWTAALGHLVDRRLTWATAIQWLMLAASYVLMGFDQPFLLVNRLFGLAQPIIDHWLSFIPLVLLLSLALLSAALLASYPRTAPRKGETTPWPTT